MLYEALQGLEQSLAAGFSPAMGTIFLAGILASAVCPCTLPVGLSLAGVAGASEAQTRRGGLAIATAFFAGIVLSITVLGTMTGRLGALATESFGRNWALVMAIVSLVAAVLAFWWPRLRLDQLTAWRRPGVAGAFGYGVVFSIGTSIAPLLLLLSPLPLESARPNTASRWPSSSGLDAVCPSSLPVLPRARSPDLCSSGDGARSFSSRAELPFCSSLGTTSMSTGPCSRA